ncbi:hypothetical protein BDR26DRAFT_892692 [Obelidium mucronatum]|nr:hypothetical protein BDR26DRAFT_892692 [Obelidium mucronatum]
MSFEQALIVLQEIISEDAFLRDASFEPHIVSKSLAFHQNDVAKTLKALAHCANWHKETLGHQSKRVSIVHVHAFLLTDVSSILPCVKGPDGRPIIIIRCGKDDRTIPKQHFGIFTMWYYLWMLRSNPDGNHNLLADFEGFKFKNFRPSEYKSINEAVACQPAPPTNSTFYAKSNEMRTLMDVSQIPVDFGGLRSMEDTRADMEEFIREEYAREGLRYEPIDIATINWKTYKVPDVDLTVRPESAMSVASNVDFDQLDAQLEKLGLDDSEE